MAQRRSRSGSPQARPYQAPATAAQLETLTENIKQVLTEFGTRLSITEHAVSQLIQDVYYAEDGEPEPCEDCDKDEAVPGDTEGSAEARERHEELPTAILDDEDDAEAARREAEQLRAEAIAIAEMENEGGPSRG